MDQELPQEVIWTCPDCGESLYRIAIGGDLSQPVDAAGRNRMARMIATHLGEHQRDIPGY